MFTTFAEIIAIVMAVIFAIANFAYYAPSGMSWLTFTKEKNAGHNSSGGGFSDSDSGSDSGSSSSNDKSSSGDGSLDDNAASGSDDDTTNKPDDVTVVEVKIKEHTTRGFHVLDKLADPDQITTSALNDPPGDPKSASSGSSSGDSSDNCSSSILSSSSSSHSKRSIAMILI
ncbi:MAG TPA: hypothetical protein VH415_00845 [Nitrososphaeraceae archaeon]|jgi:hypothetical protein